MAIKIFLDINIVVDFVDSLRPEHEAAKDLFNLIDSGKVQAYFSESVINTSAYLVRKVIPIGLFKELIINLLELIKVLPCNNLIIEQAYHLAKNDLEDAVLYQIAFANKMDFFITNNKKDFNKIAHPSLKVVSANEVVNLL